MTLLALEVSSPPLLFSACPLDSAQAFSLLIFPFLNSESSSFADGLFFFFSVFFNCLAAFSAVEVRPVTKNKIKT